MFNNFVVIKFLFFSFTIFISNHEVFAQDHLASKYVGNWIHQGKLCANSASEKGQPMKYSFGPRAGVTTIDTEGILTRYSVSKRSIEVLGHFISNPEDENDGFINFEEGHTYRYQMFISGDGQTLKFGREDTQNRCPEHTLTLSIYKRLQVPKFMIGNWTQSKIEFMDDKCTKVTPEMILDRRLRKFDKDGNVSSLTGTNMGIFYNLSFHASTNDYRGYNIEREIIFARTEFSNPEIRVKKNPDTVGFIIETQIPNYYCSRSWMRVYYEAYNN